MSGEPAFTLGDAVPIKREQLLVVGFRSWRRRGRWRSFRLFIDFLFLALFYLFHQRVFFLSQPRTVVRRLCEVHRKYVARGRTAALREGTFTGRTPHHHLAVHRPFRIHVVVTALSEIAEFLSIGRDEPDFRREDPFRMAERNEQPFAV